MGKYKRNQPLKYYLLYNRQAAKALVFVAFFSLIVFITTFFFFAGDLKVFNDEQTRDLTPLTHKLYVLGFVLFTTH